MSRHRPVETLTDILVAAISPVLIMLLVGSLVFFVLDVSYAGAFPGKMRFAAALFVIAAVLIARIAIDEGREYASMFALALGVVTFLSILRYTDASPVLVCLLVAFIWWSTDKLTWDCTVVDDQQDASGEGLLQTVGLEGGQAVDANSPSSPLLDQEATTDSGAAESPSVWRRWIEKRRRHHTPGVWVVYFGLAAIPVFGLGQGLLPAAKRGSAFLLLCIYVASALALLMTTSFLQLRRYLMQRRLPLPASTAATWFVTGAAIILSLMFLCLLLPRPHTGYSLLAKLDEIESRRDLRASRFGVGKEGVDDPDHSGQAESSRDYAATDSPAGRQASSDAQQGRAAGENDQGQGAAGSQDQKPGAGEGDQQGDDASSDQNGSEPSPDGDASDREEAQSDAERGTKQSSARSEPGPPPKSSPSRNGPPRDGSPRQSPRPNASPPPAPPNPLQFVSWSGLAKWIYFALIAVVAVCVAYRFGRDIVAAVLAFLRDLADFWRRLLGGSTDSATAVDDVETAPEVAPRRPFSSFQNPFLSGWADRAAPGQLISYTFEALQSWAEEQDCGRRAEQTPLEFVADVARRHQRVGQLARNVAVLYNQAAYAAATPGAEAAEHARKLWSAMK